MFHYFQEHDLEVPVGTYTLLRRFYVLISKNMKLDTSIFKKKFACGAEKSQINYNDFRKNLKLATLNLKISKNMELDTSTFKKIQFGSGVTFCTQNPYLS